MRKIISKNLPIYLLSGAIAFAGIANANTAQGAASVASQISTLQKQVKILQARLDNPKSVTIDYAAHDNRLPGACGDGTSMITDYSFKIDIYHQIISCSITLDIPK